MAKKQPEVTKATMERLAKSFWHLYEQRPIERISVREITENAGCNHATFYLYFRSVRDLLNKIETSLLDARDAKLKELTDGGKLDFTSLASFAQTDLIPYARVLLGPHGDPAFEREAEERIWPYLRMLMEQAGTPGLHTEDDDDTQAELTKRFYLSGISGVIKALLANPAIFEMTDVGEFIRDRILGTTKTARQSRLSTLPHSRNPESRPPEL